MNWSCRARVAASAQFLILGEGGNPVKHARQDCLTEKKAAASSGSLGYFRSIFVSYFVQLMFSRFLLARRALLLALRCFFGWLLGFLGHGFLRFQDLPAGMAYLIRKLSGQVHQ
jgi:hypothetical protein